jgi:membrane protease YdiL (CAAX protease family)
MTDPDARHAVPRSGRGSSRWVAVGLVAAGILPPLYAFWAEAHLTPQRGPIVSAAIGLGFMWAVTIVLLGVVRFGERRSFASIGLRRLPLKEALLALGAGLVLSLSVPVLALLAGRLFGVAETGTTAAATELPVWVMTLGVITAAVTEEVVFRGYLLERLSAVSGSIWIGAGLSVLLFALVHWPSSTPAHVIGVVLPLGIALTVLYLWKRSLLLVMIAHGVVDLPLVIMALARG